MSILAWWRRLTRQRPGTLDEEDFEAEVRAHLAIAADERMSDGADAKSARQAALRDFGNVTLTTEAARRIWTPRWLETLHDVTSDVRYAVRALTKNPGFSLTVISVLALGIGLNALVFAMLKGIALTPLAGVDGSSRLAVVYAETTPQHQMRVSYPDYTHLRDHNSAFADLMGTSLITAGLGRGSASRSIFGELVTGNYFRVLGVRAQVGRVLGPSDDLEPGAHPVVVLSDTLWRSDFGADPGIVGKTIELNHCSLTVVGVADPAFHGTIVSYDVEIYVPIMMTAEVGVFDGPPATSAVVLSDRSRAVLFPHGFLRPGVSVATAAAETTAMWTTLARDRTPVEQTQHLRVDTLPDAPTGAQKFIIPALVVLNAMGLLVLMIVCANIAGLVVVRGLSRRGEIAMRLALGATRTRIVRLLIVENLVLAVPAALVGMLIAARGIPIFVNYTEALAAPERLFFNMGVDRFVMAFAVIVACGSALVFGFVPALKSARVDLLTVVKDDLSPRGSARSRLRAGLVIAQVAVSILLLVGAGLVTKSLEAAQSADLGFDPSHVTAVSIDLRQNGYDRSRGLAFYRRLLDLARAEPGVESATLAAVTPMGLLEVRTQPIAIDGYVPAPDEHLEFMYNTVGPDYLRTLRIGLPFGREFRDSDNEHAAPVAIVNTTLAEKFWGGGANAIGQRIRVGDDWRTIVGVAKDVKYARVNELPRPYVYVPLMQAYGSNMILHLRGPAPVDDLVTRARAEVAALDANLPFMFAKPLAERVRGAIFPYKLTATMLFIFGVAGLVLAALGTYGLVSYTVRQSTHEIGIRMALGATAASVVRVFLSRGLWLGAIGAAVGIVIALGASRLIQSLLFGVSSTDATSFSSALLVVLGGVLVATLLPAWRASRTDPLRALRHQ